MSENEYLQIQINIMDKVICDLMKIIVLHSPALNKRVGFVMDNWDKASIKLDADFKGEAK